MKIKNLYLVVGLLVASLLQNQAMALESDDQAALTTFVIGLTASVAGHEIINDVNRYTWQRRVGNEDLAKNFGVHVDENGVASYSKRQDLLDAEKQNKVVRHYVSYNKKTGERKFFNNRTPGIMRAVGLTAAAGSVGYLYLKGERAKAASVYSPDAAAKIESGSQY